MPDSRVDPNREPVVPDESSTQEQAQDFEKEIESQKAEQKQEPDTEPVQQPESETQTASVQTSSSSQRALSSTSDAPEPVSYTANVTRNGQTTPLELPVAIEDETDQQVAERVRTEISRNLLGEEEWSTLEGWTKNSDSNYSIELGIHSDAGGGPIHWGNRTYGVEITPNYPPLDTTGLTTVSVGGEELAFDLNGAEFTPEEATFLANYDWRSTVTVLPDLGDLGEEPFALVRTALITEFGAEQGEAAYQKLMAVEQVFQDPSTGVARVAAWMTQHTVLAPMRATPTTI